MTAITGAMSSKWAKGTGGPSGDEAQNLVAVAACSPPLTSNPYGDHESREALFIAHTLRAEGFDASEDGTGRGTPLIACYENHGQDSRVKDCGDLSPTIHAKAGTGGNNLPLVAFSCKNNGNDAGDVAPALRAMNHDKSHMNGGGQVAVAFQQNASGEVRQGNVGYTLNTNSNASGRNTGMVAYRTAGNCGPFETSDRTACLNTATDPNQTIIQTHMAVRRLTPRECERLQGFPDDWTATDADGKRISDSARYRMLGNAVAVPVARWIGERMKRICEET